jgi:hypothetical protein
VSGSTLASIGPSRQPQRLSSPSRSVTTCHAASSGRIWDGTRSCTVEGLRAQVRKKWSGAESNCRHRGAGCARAVAPAAVSASVQVRGGAVGTWPPCCPPWSCAASEKPPRNRPRSRTGGTVTAHRDLSTLGRPRRQHAAATGTCGRRRCTASRGRARGPPLWPVGPSIRPLPIPRPCWCPRGSTAAGVTPTTRRRRPGWWPRPDQRTNRPVSVTVPGRSTTPRELVPDRERPCARTHTLGGRCSRGCRRRP